MGASRTLEAEIAIIMLVRFRQGQAWQAMRTLALSRYELRAKPGLLFFKSLGSGAKGGFGLVPSLHTQGFIGAFCDASAVDQFLAHSELVQTFRAYSEDLLICRMHAVSSRGTWDGSAPFTVSSTPPTAGQPVAALTRASIRPWKAGAFWRHVAASQAQLASAEGCVLAVGLGEAPAIRQATFTIWETVEALNAYSTTAAHGRAARSSMSQGYFSEWMFTRFALDAWGGTWQGRAMSGGAVLSAEV